MSIKSLTEFIKKELKEISGTVGGTAAIKRQNDAKRAVKTARATQSTKKTAWNAAKKTYTTKSNNLTTKTATFNTKDGELTAFAGNKYRKADPRNRGSYLYSSTLQRGYSLNPDWTTKNNARFRKQ